MSVRPYHSRDRSVDIPCVGHFLCSSFRMKIHKNDMGLLPDLFQRPIRSSKRIVDLRHKGTSLQIEHSNFEIGALNRIDSVTKSRRSEEHTSELQSRGHPVCRLLLQK